MMKLILNTIKWGLIFVGIVILVNENRKEGERMAMCHSGMADVIIDTQNNRAFFSIYDNYGNTEAIIFELEKPDNFKFFKNGKIRLYIQKKDKWQQLIVENNSKEPFFISLHKDMLGTNTSNGGTLMNFKYECDFKSSGLDLVRFHPYRIYCGMEFMHSLKKMIIATGLIICALIGECTYLIFVFFNELPRPKGRGI